MNTNNTEVIIKVNNFLSNLDRSVWRHIYRGAFANASYDEDRKLVTAGTISYLFDPCHGNSIISRNRAWLKPEKFKAIYKWYHDANPWADWIIDYFEEYKHCIDVAHDTFRSNYGVYVYGENNLTHCFEELAKNKNSRRACIVINDRNIALNDGEIDKLCTNAVNFFIRGNYLSCVVQMRSSNMVTLFPYDVFMFSVFHIELWQMLHTVYDWLKPGAITMQIADAHITIDDLPHCFNRLNTEDIDLATITAEFDKASTNDSYKMNLQL